MDHQDRLEILIQELEVLEKPITKEMFKEWSDHPVTKFFKTVIDIKILEKAEFLENGAYVDLENGLRKAAVAKGGKMALEDLLEIKFGEDDEG